MDATTTLRLQRDQAPFSSDVWDDIDDAARQIAHNSLSARRLFGVDGPHGLHVAALNTGRHRDIGVDDNTGIDWAVRESIAMVELRHDFSVPHAAIAAAVRGAEDADWDPVEDAVRRITTFEETAVYAGVPAQGLTGILADCTHEPVRAAPEPNTVLDAIARARLELLASGMTGPFALVAGGPFMEVLAHTHPQSGRPLRRLAADIIEGDIVWTPGIADAILVSRADGNFSLSLGHDLVLGYAGEGDNETRLFVFQSFAFRTLEPRAAIPLQLGG